MYFSMKLMKSLVALPLVSHFSKKKKKINSQLKSKVLIVAFRISNYFVGQIT